MAKRTKVTPSSTESVEEVENKANRKAKMADKSTILELDQNLADYEDFEPLPKGEYPATIMQAEMRTSDKGNDYYYIQFQIHPDDYPPDYAPENAPEGLNLVYARVQRPDQRNRRSITGVKNLIRALGMDLNVSVINPGEWEGKKAKLVLTTQEWQGDIINSIQRIEALD